MLNYDMARCGNGEKCPSRDMCLRWLDKGHPTYQVFAAFYVTGSKCENLIRVGERRCLETK